MDLLIKFVVQQLRIHSHVAVFCFPDDDGIKDTFQGYRGLDKQFGIVFVKRESEYNTRWDEMVTEFSGPHRGIFIVLGVHIRLLDKNTS